MVIFRKSVRWLLLGVSGLLVLSGFGITHYQVVSQLTLGLLNKAQAFQLHNFLAVPFVVLLVLHVVLASKFFGLNNSK
ncbi:hypothetical protein EPO05_04390 [Patescibacteria group bacterium]|nr:MAG: hypothetical protein EPO05_04390 [Patescibacteria group bacterium]